MLESIKKSVYTSILFQGLVKIWRLFKLDAVETLPKKVVVGYPAFVEKAASKLPSPWSWPKFMEVTKIHWKSLIQCSLEMSKGSCSLQREVLAIGEKTNKKRNY